MNVRKKQNKLEYKLLKELPFMKKGSIFVFNKVENSEEEFCYYFSYVKGGNKNKVIIFSQDIVENCPNWFKPVVKSDTKGAWYE